MIYKIVYAERADLPTVCLSVCLIIAVSVIICQPFFIYHTSFERYDNIIPNYIKKSSF